MAMKGKVYKFGNDINTDLIISGRYKFSITDPNELAKHIFEDVDPDFYKKLQNRYFFIVAGKNFGCGSSREQAPIAIKAAGIQAVVAKSFARIFYRNSFNIGLPIFESSEATDKIREGDEIEIDAGRGIIRNMTRDEQYGAKPIPRFMQELISAGGLIEWTKKKIRG